ncbi:TetR/AcrR family transcriptional regulator [Camelliibacillus cellulosilyticus]|uniref:TetR/AcrR family transcriptional regulator n=1 Tax=Camelliibacillus cellulosilyticus TaxID=2174486 RepID=A0ABV9GLZ6_9BACL
MDGFERRRERKKAAIQQAALELFSTYGVQKVSIAEIAKKAKVSQVTIYNYFGSKDELLRAVVMRLMNEKYEAFKEMLAQDLPFPEKVKQVIFDKTETAKQLKLDFLDSIVTGDTVLNEFYESFIKEKSLPLLINFIEQGRREGYVHQKLSTAAILFYFDMFKDAIYRPGIFTEQNQNILWELTDLFFYGLIGKRFEESERC